MKYYERFRNLREDHDKNQKEIAEIIGVQQTYYSKQERGIKPFQVEQIKILCEYYNVSADYILGLKPGMDWPREERSKRRNTPNCTKYAFLYKSKKELHLTCSISVTLFIIFLQQPT